MIWNKSLKDRIIILESKSEYKKEIWIRNNTAYPAKQPKEIN